MTEPTTPAPLSPGREQEIRHVLNTLGDSTSLLAVPARVALSELLTELDRVRAELEPGTTPAVATPCSVPDPCADGDLCDRLETEQAHAAGDHGNCGVTCEVEYPSIQLRNFILAKGYPGTKGMLDELLRRAGQPAVPVAVPVADA